MLSKKRRIAFVVSEDWFFASHFLPMLRAAVDADMEVFVVCRVKEHGSALENHGARIIPFNLERRNNGLLRMAVSIFLLAKILREQRIHVVHCIALRSIIIGGFASILANVNARILAVTGGGLLSAETGFRMGIGRRALELLVRLMSVSGNTHFLFENVTDPKRFGLSANSSQVLIVPGAGVDPVYFEPQAPTHARSLRIAIVCRMVWSKGIDLAVEAVTIARRRGHDVELSIFGSPDPSNPRSLTEEVLRDWSLRPGIQWCGPTTDVRRVWANHDLACLPSRGGEGLPRSILEAAACGRPILTTDVPGCRDFVRSGREGWLVPPDNAAALADCIGEIEANRKDVSTAGKRARERLTSGYTEQHVRALVTELYRGL